MQMKSIELSLELINFPSEEEIPVLSVVIPEEGTISTSHNPIIFQILYSIFGIREKRIVASSMQNIQYKIFYN